MLAHSRCWKQELREALCTLEQLVHADLISREEAFQLSSVGKKFKVRIPRYYAALMEKSPSCPIRKQALPQLEETDPELSPEAHFWSEKIYGRSVPWHSDAIGDLRLLVAPRLTHRYLNRAILHASSSCALYCRFCFRKSHLNDSDRLLYQGNFKPALEYLKGHSTIRELILTGGDPLSLSDEVLEKLLDQLALITHIRSVRIHSRMVVTLPSRVTSTLVSLLGRERPFQVRLTSHFNHPKELTSSARSSLSALRRMGVHLLNQAVLLKGVNDQTEILAELFQTLYEIGVTPYYLHHPDWTPGTFHFRVPIRQGQAIARSLRGLISGPALPTYVLDLPQGMGKINLLDSEVIETERFGGGSVYHITPPWVRQSNSSSRAPIPYLDLYPEKAVGKQNASALVKTSEAP